VAVFFGEEFVGFWVSLINLVGGLETFNNPRNNRNSRKNEAKTDEKDCSIEQPTRIYSTK
jgi:hypothetical protein